MAMIVTFQTFPNQVNRNVSCTNPKHASKYATRIMNSKKINIEWFENNDNSKIILAGGLDSNNVASLKEYGFYGVDVSSGVEVSHGIKSKEKVQNFISNAR